MNPTLTGVGARLMMSAFGIFVAGAAHASLGGDEASVEADRSELNGSLATHRQPHFTLQEITTDSGMVLREFLSPAGVVFAVSWSGPALPDLNQLLGSSYATYVHTLSQLKRAGVQRSLKFRSDTLIIEQSGHLRSYVGRALLPAMLPAGVTLEELR